MLKEKNNIRSSIFVGNYLEENIQIERGLRAPNPATSNRMWRLSRAIQTMGYLSYIISPACSARIKFNPKIIHPTKIIRKNGIIIIYAPALAIPFLNIIFELFSMSWIFLRLSFLRKVKVTMLYCYYPSTIFVGVIAKIKKIKIIEDLEDIVTPRLSDWFYKPIMFSLQQAAGGLLMNLAIRLSDLIIVPSSRFLFKNIENSNHIVVDGCIDVSADTQMYFENKKINILFAGMLDEEQGVNLYLQTLKLINENKELARRFKFNVCGLSQQEEALKVSLSSFNHLDITYNGFVSSNEYNVILNGANVCLVLQDPTGRYAQKKTPSKGYEYMASGKLIIVTKIGDYSNLPKNTCLFLNNYTPESLVEILINLDKSTIVNFAENAKHYAIENWGFKNVGKKIIKRIL